jgi:hypothetical protein
VLHEKGDVSGRTMLSAIGATAAVIDRTVGEMVSGAMPQQTGADSTVVYLAALERAMRSALNAGAAVVLVVPPGDGASEGSDRRAAAEMVAARFAGESRVRFQDLSLEGQLVQWTNRPNGFDFSSAGIANASKLIAPPVTELVRPLLD